MMTSAANDGAPTPSGMIAQIRSQHEAEMEKRVAEKEKEMGYKGDRSYFTIHGSL